MRHRELWEELAHLAQAYPTNVAIGWIVEGKVVPQESAPRNQNPIDFVRYFLLHILIEYRGEQHELGDEIEAAIGKWKRRGATTNCM